MLAQLINHRTLGHYILNIQSHYLIKISDNSS